MTRWEGLALAAALAALTGVPLEAHGTPSAAPVTEAVDTATISVSASADVRVTPDRARLTFAIETEAETAAEATRRNAELATAAIEAARPFLGPEGDLSTSNFSVSPVYARDAGRRVIGYRATNALVLVLDDLEAVGPVIDAATRAGANRIDRLVFFAADTRDAYLAALADAVERARAEAEVMARASGGRLGRIVTLQSTRTGQPVRAAMAESVLTRADTPIEPGDQQVGASVRLEIQLLAR